MARGMYIGVDDKARKVKQMYVGVDSKARRVKKGYIGIGGVARPFWGGEALYYGSVTALSEGRQNLAATTVGNYALFGGGLGSSRSNVVDAYNTSLTRSTPAALSEKKQCLAATTVGNYALFGGGTAGSSRSNVVDAYTA